MEQVWQKIKGDNLTNTTFKNYDDIVDRCAKAWNSFCDNDGNIAQLCRYQNIFIRPMFNLRN